MRTVLYILIYFFSFLSLYGQENSYLYQIGIADTLYSKTLNETRTIYVQIPESYQQNSNQKYPVVYIIDGEIFLPTVSNILEFYSGGFMPEMVLIGISNEKNRTRDLTISKINSKYGMPFNEENGEASSFLKFIEDELIPYVEKMYPVTNYRSLIGHSYGGLFSTYTLMHKPELFANYLCIDPSLDWDNQKILKQMKEVSSKDYFSEKSLYVSLSGQLHMQNSKVTIDNVMQDTTDYTLFARSNINFSNFIKQIKPSGLEFNWQFYSKDIHGTVPQPSIRDGLISVFEWYQMENTDKINNPESTKDELLQIINNRENKLNKHFGYAVPPYPEFLLNMSGYMNLEMQQLEKSKMYFELAIKYYPTSANAYDSMADYYSAQNDTINALKFVTKAYNLSGDNYYKERMKLFNNK
ncbi:MAG: alpha/beta hydrolase-fold protein [Flavobacteriaceae bacterium]